MQRFDLFFAFVLPYYNIKAERALSGLSAPKNTRSVSCLILSSEIALDLEPVGAVLLLFHYDMLMIKIEMHRRAQIRIAGQTQQLLHPLLLLRHIEQIAHALLLARPVRPMRWV